MIFDLGNLLVNLWKVWKEDRELQAWIRLILATFYSGTITFSVTCGSAFLSGSHELVAVGLGLVSGASAVTAVLMRAPQTRGMFFSVPVEAVEKSTDGKQTIITGPTK